MLLLPLLPLLLPLLPLLLPHLNEEKLALLTALLAFFLPFLPW